MSEKKNYDLICLDSDCILDKKNEMLNPDLTSIVDAFENGEDPSTLFLNNSKFATCAIEAKLNDVHANLDNIKIWLERALIPCFQMINQKNIRKHIPSISLLENKMVQLAAMAKRVRKRYSRKRELKSVNKQYKYVCPVCDKNFILENSNDWLILEKHDHIAQILSSYKIPLSAESKDFLQTNNSATKEITQLKNKNNTTIIFGKSVTEATPRCLYSSEVRNVLYPLKLMSKIFSIEKNSNFYTIQAISASQFYCLMCLATMYRENTVYAHIAGNKHKNNLSDQYECNRVKKYHDLFANLPNSIQMHQVVFKPGFKIQFLFCEVCAQQIYCDKIERHINSEKHKTRLLSKQFFAYNFYDEMLTSLLNHSTNFQNENERSESSVESQIIYNTSYNVKSETSPAESIVSNESKNNSVKESVTTDEESDEESSETALKSRSVTDEELPIQLNNQPVQGTSNTNMIKTSPKKIKENIDDTNEKVPIEHNIVLAFKENSKNIFDLCIENRYQKHIEYVKYVNTIPHCTLCMKNILKSAKDMKDHFSSQEHKKNAEIHCGKQKYKYVCNICYKNIKNENKWTEHLNCSEHKHRVDAFHNNKTPQKYLFQEYECTTCRFVIFGNCLTLKDHLSNKFIIKTKKEIKLPHQIINLFKNENAYSAEIIKLSKESTEVLNSIELSFQCCRSIEKALEPVFGQCKAYPFGSRVSGLGNLVSDLDVFVDTGLMFDGMFYQDAENQARLVKETARALRKNKDFSYIYPIPHARTPIVQVYHKRTQLDCDLSFRHGLSVENTKYLRLCTDIQPQLKILILFLKRWSSLCKLSDRISTYALSMLSIFFFQIKNLLPSVKKIRELDPSPPKIIAGWETFHYSKPLSDLTTLYPVCNMLSKEILRDFFEYYSKFKFNTEVVCPLLGVTVLKSDFYEEKGKRLPEEMKNYVSKINENDDNEVFRAKSSMCIQDPFDLSHNLTKGCSAAIENHFVTLCQLSYQMLSK